MKYLIFEYINAKEVKDGIENFTINDKVSFAKEIRKIVVCTTDKKEDDKLVDFLKEFQENNQ